MKVRVIAGTHGGRWLEAPSGDRTHPMGERPKGALFNKLIDDIKGAEVLDVFAGTGALGIEALSRGAAHATFVERDKVAQSVISSNLKLLGLEDHATLIKTTVSNWLDTADSKHFDLILADPPYHDLQLSTVLRVMDLLKPGALMVLSHTGRSESPTKPGVVVVDNRSYGEAVLTFYRREA